jgi:hypothetical protein
MHCWYKMKLEEALIYENKGLVLLRKNYTGNYSLDQLGVDKEESLGSD